MKSPASRPMLRFVAQPATVSRISRFASRRSFANSAPRSVNRSDPSQQGPPPVAGRGKIPIFVIGAVVFLMVGGRYIAASSKPAASGVMEQKEARRSGDVSQEYRDPRDSPVKTLKDKEQ